MARVAELFRRAFYAVMMVAAGWRPAVATGEADPRFIPLSLVAGGVEIAAGTLDDRSPDGPERVAEAQQRALFDFDREAGDVAARSAP